MTLPRQAQTCTVYETDSWENDWVLLDRVYCDQFSYVAGPDVSEATLTFNYGIIQPAESLNSVSRAPQDLNGHYIRLKLTQFTDDDEETVRYWYGIVVETTKQRHGTITALGETVESGRQTFHCRGLEFLLQRTNVDTSYVTDSTGSEIEIGRAIAFNLGPGRSTDNQRLGNKSETPGERDAPIFAFEIAMGGLKTEIAEKLWSVQDIVVYLLHYHPPHDVDGHDKLNWTSPDGGDAEVLERLFPVVHAQGKSVKQIFDEIIDRRRLVGYTIDVVGDDEKPKLNVFTFNKTIIDLPSGETIAPNSNQQTWYFEDDATIQTAEVSEDDATRFDQVIVRGANLGACLTIGDASLYGASLVEDWDSTTQAAYNTGASGSGAYASSFSMDKQAMNQAFRAGDIFSKTFRAFLLKTSFNGILNSITVCPDPTLEAIDETPSTTSTAFWYPGLRFLDRLPLQTGYDYTTVEGFEASTLTIDSSQPDYLRPFAISKIGSLYYRLDHPGSGKATAETLASGGRTWAASIRMQDNCPGLFIDVHGGPQHLIASAEFLPADLDDTADAESQVDWKDIACTIFCEFDQYAEARYPSGEPSTTADVVRELIIDRPEYRLDYLTPGTVIGIDDSGALITTDGGYVRDDRAAMQDLARCAFEWYGQTRRAMTIVQHDLVCDRQIGELITNIGSASSPVEINSVVTKMVFDLLAGTVTVTTQYAELDFTR